MVQRKWTTMTKKDRAIHVAKYRLKVLRCTNKVKLLQTIAYYLKSAFSPSQLPKM